jgi:uncharacterized membrane protein
VGDGLFSAMIAVDVIVANIWMAFLLYGAGIHKQIDKKLQADTSAISELKEKIEAYRSQIMRIPDLTDTIKLMSVGFGVTALAHFGSDLIAPWIAVNAPGANSLGRMSSSARRAARRDLIRHACPPLSGQSPHSRHLQRYAPHRH